MELRHLRIVLEAGVALNFIGAATQLRGADEEARKRMREALSKFAGKGSELRAKA
jgi:hypothetical protein